MSDQYGPRGRHSKQGIGDNRPFHIEDVAISFDKEAFMNLISNHGIRVTHHRAIVDPSGMQSRGSIHDGVGSRKSSDGYIYKEAGVCSALFTSNNTQVSLEQLGMLAYSTAYMTFPELYEESQEPIIIAPYDRFYLKDIEVRVSQTQFVETNSTGIDRLQYPATYVEHLIDANGVDYKFGTDFELTEDGNIKWVGQKQPGWNVKLNQGVVYSIRYRYTPFFVVAHLVHEIRIAQISDYMGDRSLERMPYQALVYRETVFRDMNSGDPLKPMGYQHQDRFSDIPQIGGFMGPKKP